jgi:hypothetical protein
MTDTASSGSLAGVAAEPLYVSLADSGAVDQAARAALADGRDLQALADGARDLGAQLAQAIRRLHDGPLPQDRPIVVSTDHTLPPIGDTIITQEAGRILARQIRFTWLTPQGQRMTINVCPSGIKPCI